MCRKASFSSRRRPYQAELRWILWMRLWGEDLRSTSGLELGVQTLLAGAYSLTNGIPGLELWTWGWPEFSSPQSCSKNPPLMSLELLFILEIHPLQKVSSGTHVMKWMSTERRGPMSSAWGRNGKPEMGKIRKEVGPGAEKCARELQTGAFRWVRVDRCANFLVYLWSKLL